MPREIKFRAWDRENSRLMIDGFLIRPWDGRMISSEDSNMQHLILMQFTGLKDKNGKEIYEGDIVKGWHYEEMDTGIGIDRLSQEDRTFAVEWDNDNCGFNLYGSDDFEVIGNIYENPDLVKQ